MKRKMGRARWNLRSASGALLLVVAGLALGSSRGATAERWVDAAALKWGTLAALAEPPVPPADLVLDPGILADDGRSAAGGPWRSALAQYALDDLRAPPVADGIVFIGSSSIRRWADLGSSFPRQHVVGRGLGGSHLADTTRFVDRLVLPHQPRTVVVYAGDNDLADGASPEHVRDDFAALVARIKLSLPATRIVYVSIKPSLARDALLPVILRANAEIASFARSEPGLSFVDVFAPMLGDDGHARPSLFDADGLHLNADGYTLWRETLSRHLDLE